MMHIALISDFHYSQLRRGAESNDHCLESLLSRNHKVTFLRTTAFNERFRDLEDVGLFVFSNFSLISPSAEEFAQGKNYLIIEHDYKFLRSRNPLLYPDFIVPADEIVHECFYAQAKVVVLQSRLQLSIFQKNLKLHNYYCLSGNLWPDEELDLMERISRQQKVEKAAILISESPAKGTQAAVDYCQARRIPYALLPETDHVEFLRVLGRYSSFVFLPASLESFSRVCLEAKMMGLKVITNDLVGVAAEEAFLLPPGEVVERMREKKAELLELIQKHL